MADRVTHRKCDCSSGTRGENCGVLSNRSLICTRPAGHRGDHYAAGWQGVHYQRWARAKNERKVRG